MAKFLLARRAKDDYHIIESCVVEAPDALSCFDIKERMWAKPAPADAPFSDWETDPALTEAMRSAGETNNG